MRCVEQHGQPVSRKTATQWRGAASDDQGVEDLVVAEHGRPRVRPLEGVDDRPDRVQAAADGQQRQLGAASAQPRTPGSRAGSATRRRGRRAATSPDGASSQSIRIATPTMASAHAIDQQHHLGRRRRARARSPPCTCRRCRRGSSSGRAGAAAAARERRAGASGRRRSRQHRRHADAVDEDRRPVARPARTASRTVSTTATGTGRGAACRAAPDAMPAVRTLDDRVSVRPVSLADQPVAVP